MWLFDNLVHITCWALVVVSSESSMEEERYATGVLPGSFMTKTKPTYLNLDAGWYLVHEGTGRDKELGKQRCWRLCVEVNFYTKWECWKKECH